jgi:biotin transport system ATP-binding protein
VSVRLAGRQVLHGIDLALGEHRIAVIGANGSGKSTLARLLNGLVQPDEGRVEVDGLDVRRHGALVRRQVGFVFTDPDAQIVMPTVAEDVAFSLRRLKLGREPARQRVTQILNRFGLEEHADHPAHLLSGGQKQLLAIASVVVTEPRVLVCDEPTTLLDLRNTNLVLQLLAGLDQQVVMITHALEAVAGFDRVICIDQGRVAADGPPEEVVAAYRALMADQGSRC